MDSEVDQGTFFRIYLPETDQLRAPKVAERPSREQAARAATVLVAEDDQNIRLLVARVLRKHGFEILAAESGEEALGIAEKHRGAIDLLLTDVVMPDLPGPALAAELCEHRPDCRVLYMSGYTDSIITRMGPGENLVMLQKPFGERALVEAVRAILQGENPPARTSAIPV